MSRRGVTTFSVDNLKQLSVKRAWGQREFEDSSFNWWRDSGTMTQANRKRGRSIEDESSEFTPLSKRINNLHINNLSKLCEGTNEPPLEQEWSNGNFAPSPNHSEPSQSSSSSDGYSNPAANNFVPQPDYQPDLSATENPYYYENNKLLYSLYVERMHRRVNFHDL